MGQDRRQHAARPQPQPGKDHAGSGGRHGGRQHGQPPSPARVGDQVAGRVALVVVDGGEHMPGAEQQRGPQHRRGRRAPLAEQRQQDAAEQQLLGQRGGEGDADREVVGGFAATDVADAPVLEVGAGRGQGGPEGDDAGGHGGGAEPRAQPTAGMADVDPEVGRAAAGTPGEAGEPDGGDEVQRRIGRRGQRPVHGEVVDGQHRHPDGRGRDRPPARHGSGSAGTSPEDAGSRRISTSSRPSDWMRSSRPWSEDWSSTGPCRTVSTGSTLAVRPSNAASAESLRRPLIRIS
jgi:hypothetical protein